MKCNEDILASMCNTVKKSQFKMVTRTFTIFKTMKIIFCISFFLFNNRSKLKKHGESLLLIHLTIVQINFVYKYLNLILIYLRVLVL